MNKQEAEEIYKNSPMQGNVGTPEGAQEVWARAYSKGFLEGYSQMENWKDLARELLEELKNVCETDYTGADWTHELMEKELNK
jgi:flagellar biosynthesis/type III secretory pathway protein FliH